MKFTLSWLKEHLETEASLREITDRLTAIGLELEGVEDRAADLAPFTVAHVIEARQHPNADRLRVCLVDTGSEQVQVVCGAPNARTGMKGVFAPSGTTIPGTGLHLKPSKIRGEESNGMLCSEREMGLSDEHDGIIELPEDAPVGAAFAPYMGLDDPVIDIAITPNRQDCLGVRGVARDLAAAGLGRLKPFEPPVAAGTFASPISVALNFDEATADACTCFVGRYFRGVKNGPSPDWLQRRLRAIGLRPISALVDITNYVTYDLGRPLHVFDADTVHGNIQARLARPGESLVALNDKTYTLDGAMTVIADDEGPEGIGGVMGGLRSGCTEETVNVFLEVALFDPVRTATTGRRLQIDSDARYRFERGVDPAMVLPGAHEATRLIQALCGGEASELVIAGSPEQPPRSVRYRPARVGELVALDVPEAEQRRILEDLGFVIEEEGGAAWQVRVPSWRSDVDGEADLIEDIARIHGYDAMPAVPLPRDGVVAQPVLTEMQKRRSRGRRTLAHRGMVECVTWSFLPRRFAELFGGGGEALILANPISSELDAMRPSLLPNLIEAAGRNADRGFSDTALFEVGPQFAGDRPEDQDWVAAGVRRGRAVGRHWSGPARPVDVFDAKADALAVLEAVGAPVDKLQVFAEAPGWYHPGRSGELRLGPKNLLARFGEVHPRVLDAMDVAGPLVAFEVFYTAAPQPKAAKSRTRARLEASDFPAAERDFAFIVDAGVAAGDIVRAAAGAEKTLISRVEVFDVYEGERLGEGRKSVAIGVRLEPRDRTLTDAEIDQVAEKVVAAVGKATGAELRG